MSQLKRPDQSSVKRPACDDDNAPVDDDAGEEYEPCYRDGSLKNECWNDRAGEDG